MTEKTKQALEESIAHWKRLHADPVEAYKRGEDVYSHSCALCLMFYHKDCRGCPVANATGFPKCHRTPWHEASRLFDKLNSLAGYSEETLASFRKAATTQIEFLESLRQTETKNKFDV